MSSQLHRLAIAALAGLALQACGPSTYQGTDKLDFANRPVFEPLPTSGLVAGPFDRAEEVGVLVDGRLGPSGPHLNDAGFVVTAPRLAIPNRRNRNFGDIFYPDRRQEVLTFAPDRRLEITSTPWRGGEDIFQIDLKPRIDLPVTVWIVSGVFDTQRIQAMEGILRTLSIWRAERVGLGLSDIRIINSTGDPQAAENSDIPANPSENGHWRPLREEIGFEPDRLNIYWVNTVDSAATSGWSNFGLQIVMGRNTGDELLSHEIGHALSLTHINDLTASFDVTNVMHNASSTRQFMTEGQTARAQLDPRSSVWSILFLDVGQPIPNRQCDRDVVSGKCPAIDRRIWADGTFPANN